MKHPLSRALGALLLVPMLLACGDDDKGPTDTDTVSGTYALVTVNGDAVPATMLEQELDGFVFTIVAKEGSLELDDGAYDLTVTINAFVDGEPLEGNDEPQTESGTYTVSSNTITLKSAADGQTTTGTVSGNKITFVVEDEELGGEFSFVFQK